MEVEEKRGHTGRGVSGGVPVNAFPLLPAQRGYLLPRRLVNVLLPLHDLSLLPLTPCLPLRVRVVPTVPVASVAARLPVAVSPPWTRLSLLFLRETSGWVVFSRFPVPSNLFPLLGDR